MPARQQQARDRPVPRLLARQARQGRPEARLGQDVEELDADRRRPAGPACPAQPPARNRRHIRRRRTADPGTQGATPVTEEEPLVLTRYVKACCPQQAFDRYTPDAWPGLLD